MDRTATRRAVAVEPHSRHHVLQQTTQLAKLAARGEALAAAVLCLLGFGLRLRELGEHSFWIDEMISFAVATTSLGDLPLALTVEANMSLYYVALFIWLRIVGFLADEATIRLLSVLLGAAAVPLVYLLGRRLHSSLAGLAAAALLAVNGFHIAWSQELRGYAAFATLTVLSYLLLDRALHHGRRRDWLLHAVVTGLAFYSHFFTAFTLVAQGLFVLSRRSRTAIAGFVASGLAFGLCLVPLLPYVWRHLQMQGTKFTPAPPSAEKVEQFFVNFGGGSNVTLLAYVVAALAGVLLATRGHRSAGYRSWLLLTWFLVPIGLVLVITQERPIFRERFMIATLPALPLLAGVGLASMPRLLAVGVFGTLFSLSLIGIDRFHGGLRESWREAAGYAMSEARPEDGWIFVTKEGQHGFEFHGGWRWGANPAVPHPDVFEPYDWRAAYQVPLYRGVTSLAGLDAFAATHSRIWFVISHSYDDVQRQDAAEPVDAWLIAHGYEARERRFQGVRVVLYERTGPVYSVSGHGGQRDRPIVAAAPTAAR